MAAAGPEEGPSHPGGAEPIVIRLQDSGADRIARPLPQQAIILYDPIQVDREDSPGIRSCRTRGSKPIGRSQAFSPQCRVAPVGPPIVSDGMGMWSRDLMPA